MRLRGTIKDGVTNETIPQANVFVSDKNGKLITPTVGTATDFDGKFKLEGVEPSDYVSISYIGYRTITKKMSDLGSGVSVAREFLLQPETSELEEFTVVAERDEPTPILARKEKRNYTPYIIGGVALLLIIGGYVTYRVVKKN